MDLLEAAATSTEQTENMEVVVSLLDEWRLPGLRLGHRGSE